MMNEPELRQFRAFGAWLQAPLSTLLHETAVVRCVEQKTLSLSALSGPVFFFHLNGDDVPASMILGFEFAPSLFFSLLDRLQGGDGLTEEENPDRALTHLERRLAERFLLLFQNAVRETSGLPEPFDFEPISTEAWSGDRTLTATGFQMIFGNCAGIFRILLPQKLRRFRDCPRLSGASGSVLDFGFGEVNEFCVNSDADLDQETGSGIEESLASTPVRVSVQLSGGKIRPQDLTRWRVGDVIPLGRPEDFPFSVLIEGTEKFSAAPGRFKSRKAFRIL